MEISVCIPAYNAEKTIARTLRNLQFQSLKEFKIFIYDDGSTDNTYKIVSEISCKDPRIVLVRSEINKGRSEARNALLNLVSQASMIAWQDADDLWHPQKLLIQSKIYVENMHARAKDIIYTSIFRKPYFPNDEKRSRAGLIFGPQKPMRIDPPTHYDEKHVFSRRFGICPFYLQGTFGPASAYLEIGGFDKEVKWAEDLDIAIRLIANNTKIFGYKTKHCLLRYQLNLPSVPVSTLYDSIIKAANKGKCISVLSAQELSNDVLWRKAYYIFRVALLEKEYEFAMGILNENVKALSKVDWGRKIIMDNNNLLRALTEMK